MQSPLAQNYPINHNPSSPNFLYPDVHPYPSNPLNQAQDPVPLVNYQDYDVPFITVPPEPMGDRGGSSNSRASSSRQTPSRVNPVDGVCVKHDKQHVTRLNHEHLVLHYQRLFTVLLRFICPKVDFIRITRVPPGPDAKHHTYYFDEICEIIYLSAVFRLWRNKDHRRSTVSLGMFSQSISLVIADLCLDVFGVTPIPDQLDFGDSVFIVQVMSKYLSERNYLDHIGVCNDLSQRIITKYGISTDVLFNKMYNTPKTIFYN